MRHNLIFASLLFLVALSSVANSQGRLQTTEKDRVQAQLRLLPPKDQMPILRNLISRFYKSGEFNRGLEYANWALGLAKENFRQGDEDFIGALHDLGLIHSQIGHYAQAGSLAEKAFNATMSYLPEGNLLRLAVMNSMATHDALMRRFPEAEAIFIKLVNECQAKLPRDDEYTYGAIINLAGLYQDTGRYNLAIQRLEPIMADFSRLNLLDSQNGITAAVLLASSYRKADRNDDAIKLLRSTRQISVQAHGPRHPLTLVVANSLAYSLDVSGNLNEALPSYEEVARTAAETFGQDHPHTLTTELSVVSVLIRKGEKEKALQILERVGPLSLRWTRAELYETTETAGRRQLLVRQSTYPDVALTVAMQDATPAAARLAANTVFQWKRLQGAQDALLARFMATTDDPNVLELAKRLAVLRNQLAVAFHLGVPDASRLLAEVELAESKLAMASKEFAEIQTSQRVGFDEVRVALSEKTGLLEFRLYRPVNAHDDLSGERRLLGLLVRPNMEPIIRDLGVHSEIQSKVVEAADFERINVRKAALRWLSDRLLMPFQEDLRPLEKVYLALDGALNLLQVDMLPFDKAEYWIQIKDLRYVSTGRALVTTRDVRRGGGLVAVGAAQFDSSSPDQPSVNSVEAPLSRTAGGAKRLRELRPFKHLRETGPEIASIAESWKRLTGERTTILSGTGARESVIKSLGPPPGVLHFATHGFFLANTQSNDGPMLLSGLALAGANLGIKGSVDAEGEDGILWALEAMSLNLSGTQLVTMSACDTAQGIIDASEGVYGLSRGFQIAGAENVLVTLWALNDSRARAFMEEFYTKWLGNGTPGDPADALRATKLAWIGSQNPARSNSQIWAPYVLVQRGI